MMGIVGDWAEEYPLVSASIDRAFADRDAIPLKILVWGPGSHFTDYFTKRSMIIDHLNVAPDEAYTSEMLNSREPRFSEMHSHDAEFIHVTMSDIVFVLVINDEKVTGSQAEVAIFRQHKVFTDRAFLIIPKLTKAKTPRSFISQGWTDYDSSRTFPYTEHQFIHCKKIRAYCESTVRKIRTQRFLQQMRAR